MNKKVVLILCVVFAALLIGAGVLYNSLSDQVQVGGLATRPTGESVPTESTPAETAPVESAPAQSVPEETQAPEEVDYSAPDFTVLDWDGNERKLSEFEGKPVILNFWASWCGPCKSEMPDFEEAYKKYEGKIHFLMVCCADGSHETVESAKAFIEESGYTFPVYFDTTLEAASLYGANSIPLTYFIDANGDLVTYGRGALSPEMLAAGIGYIYTEE